MKTNKQLNQEHDKAQAERVRPKQPEYQFEALEAVIRQWILANK